MKQENRNRGFVATSVLYTLVTILAIVLFVIVRNLSTTRSEIITDSGNVRDFLSSYVIVYQANGGTGTMANSRFVSGKDNPLRANAFSRAGYTYAGWGRSSSTSYNASDLIPNKALVNNQGSTNHNVHHLPVLVNQTIFLYAIWKPRSYTVTFNGNGGSIVGNTSKTVTYDSTYGAMPSATRTNYNFLGWATAPTGGELITSSTPVKILSNQTLYARWNLKDMVGPTLVVTTPSGASTASPTYYQSDSTITYSVSGTVSDPSGVRSVTVNGVNASISGNTYRANLSLSANALHTIRVVATDQLGNPTTVTKYIKVETYYQYAARVAGTTIPSSLDQALKDSAICTSIANNNTAANMMKSKYSSQMNSYIDSNFNQGLNYLNYKVGLKSYLLKNGDIQTNIWGASTTITSHTATTGSSFSYQWQVYPYDNYDRYSHTLYPPMQVVSNGVGGKSVTFDDNQYYRVFGQFNTPIYINTYGNRVYIQIQYSADKGGGQDYEIGISNAKTPALNNQSGDGDKYKSSFFTGGSSFNGNGYSNGVRSGTLSYTTTNYFYLKVRVFNNVINLYNVALIPM